MMLLLIISTAVTVFLLVAAVLVMLTGKDPVEARLMEVSVYTAPDAGTLIAATPSTGLARAAAQVMSLFNPFRGLVSGFDQDLAFKLTLAGFRKPEHVEIFTAAKLLLPVAGITAGSFFGSNMIAAVLVGAVGGFFLPDMALSYLVSRRQTNIRIALPDALDLLVICMEAGLGIDQALVRVGEEMAVTAPALAEEFQIVNREQRAGKQNRCANLRAQSRIEIAGSELVRFDSKCVRASPLRFRTDGDDQLDQCLDVPDMRDVLEVNRFVREQRGCDDRQRGVLVS